MNVNSKNAAELSYISKWAGCCEDITQAGGGNTSVKQDNGLMLIKSSGYSLSDVTASDGYSVVDHRKIIDLLGSSSMNDEKAILSAALIEGKRPSIETFLHSMTKKYTIHTHPLCVTMLAVRKSGMAELRSLFPESVTVGYAAPGLPLSELVLDAVKGKPEPGIVFLQNHGLIVSADTMQDAVNLHRDIIVKINSYLGISSDRYLLNCRLFDVVNSFDSKLIAYPCDNEYVSRALKLSGGGEWEYKFSPDCVVYCGSRFAVISDGEDSAGILGTYIAENGMPKIVLADNHAFIIAENIKKAKDTESVLAFTAKIYLSESRNDIHTLDDEETDHILNMDSEKYRRAIKY